ncbi:MAG TPA: uroporphyrinogen-III synthase [Polyangiaceae bacterium]|nr:uroporphyrinogen-III synthase [Polyangiaceae bacterium]
MGGLVSFVSLGPGDPELRTARASARLAQADVVIDANKSVSPEKLVAMARAGKVVARAVVGDALSSVQALKDVLAVSRAGVALEVVPGVGARASAAAFAGLVGRATRVGADEVEAALASEPREAVVTLVADVGEPSQRVVVTTAADAPAKAKELGVSWMVLAIGAPADELRWFEARPLFGKRVLVTRPREQAGTAASMLRELGAEPVVVPTIELRPPRNRAALARAVRALRAGEYTWAAFTSANGVDATWEALVAARGDARAFGGVRLAAIGPATAAALEEHGLRADVVAREFIGEGLAKAMLSKMKGGARAGGKERGRVLLARAAKARDVLPEALRKAGWQVDVVAAYESHPPKKSSVSGLARELAAGRIDAVTFTSSSTVDNLCTVLGRGAPGLLARTRVASIGPVTTQTARKRGLRVDVMAAEYTVPGLIRALAASYG